jgi:pimeloyl-ACP methyl ester carboxylesterase
MKRMIFLYLSMPLCLFNGRHRKNTRRRTQRVLQLILCVCAVMSLNSCVKRLDSRVVLQPTVHDKFIKIDSGAQDVYLHYLDYPGEGRKVVLLHGFGSSTFTWEDMVPKLQKKFRDDNKPVPHVLAVDIKGCGWSDKPRNAKYDPFTLTDEVSAWMEKVGVDNATVVGNSLGGALALVLALDHPEKVGRLVLVDAGGYPPDKKDYIAALFAYVPFPGFWINLGFNRWMAKWGLRKAFYDPEKVTDARIDAYFDRLRTRGCIESIVAQALSADPELFLTYAGRIPYIKQETIIIWGRNDGWIPLKYGCRFNQDIKRSKLFVIPECGHVPQEEKPDEFAQILYHFLVDNPRVAVGNTGAH